MSVMDRSTVSGATAGRGVLADHEEEMESDELTKMMQREWNTVDFAGKCKRVS